MTIERLKVINIETDTMAKADHFILFQDSSGTSPSENSTSKWFDETFKRIREKREAEEAAISKWMQENPQATAAQYIEQVKKISEAVR